MRLATSSQRREVRHDRERRRAKAAMLRAPSDRWRMPSLAQPKSPIARRDRQSRRRANAEACGARYDDRPSSRDVRVAKHHLARFWRAMFSSRIARARRLNGLLLIQRDASAALIGGTIRLHRSDDNWRALSPVPRPEQRHRPSRKAGVAASHSCCDVPRDVRRQSRERCQRIALEENKDRLL